MIIKKVKLSQLKEHRIHSEIYAVNDLEDLKQSILESGLLVKIVVDKQFVIISGVRRFHALKELGYEETEVIVRDENDDDEPLTVIAFNKQRQKTASELLKEVEHLKDIWSAKRGRKSADEVRGEKVDTRAKIAKATNTSAGNISKLEKINEKNPALISKIDQGDLSINQAHKIVETQEKRTKVIDLNASLPQVISHNDYKIYNKSSDDLSDIPDESVQMVFTSPPYWQKRVYSNESNELGAEQTSEEYVQRMADHLFACYRVLKPKGSFFLNLGDTKDKCLQSIPHRVQIELCKRGFILQNCIIWKKSNPLPGTGNSNLTNSYEFIFHMVKGTGYVYNEILAPLKAATTPKVTIINRKGSKVQSPNCCNINISGLKDGKKLEDFWSRDIVYTAVANQATVKQYGGTDHPAPFPEEICILPILQTTNPGDTVLDLFSGSGTTGAVSLMLGRKFIGYELNPNFNKLQVARLDAAIAKYNQAQINKAA